MIRFLKGLTIVFAKGVIPGGGAGKGSVRTVRRIVLILFYILPAEQQIIGLFRNYG